jgi:hypothetical protein
MAEVQERTPDKLTLDNNAFFNNATNESIPPSVQLSFTVGVLFFPGFAEFEEPKDRPVICNGQQRRPRQLSAQQFRDGGRGATGNV